MSKDWNSSEQMHRKDEVYRQGIVVEHNTPAAAKGGSCIFMHIWRSNSTPTDGCTAMDPQNIKHLLDWLDPQKNPLLVQMPVAQYELYKERWKLPER
ncbi:L,D-transpeptidase family protein [Pseudomonas sp. ANT_H12B]|uniref:L,D-transpeptidase family protein n=1 Tax=Pseudomonas sp. ANT_H12B TaxID=2597348 RepID=UPI00273EE702|nr:L,D-transpeptidase family protein [Pseudomonas sp. ANT_H12B]